MSVIDKETLVAEIEKTSAEIQQLFNSLSEQQINTVPYKHSWTAGQMTDHLHKSYTAISKAIIGNTAAMQRNGDEKIEEIKKIFLNFERTLKSPDFIVPEIKSFKKTELSRFLKTEWDSLKESAKNLDLLPSCLDFQLPGLGTLTRYEWIYFAVYHTKRHIWQLRRIIKGLEILDATA